MLKKCKVVMLPTNEKAIINLNTYRLDKPILNVDKEIENYTTNPYQLIIDRGYQPQHLYIIIDEEIKEGDWYFNHFENKIFKAALESHGKHKFKKIIATTDNSIWEHDDTVPYPKTKPALPQPSQSFIKKYVEEYNKGNVITDVLVEYEKHFDEDWSDISGAFEYQTLKVNPKDNTITIKK